MAWGETRTEAADLHAMREAGLNITGFCTPADVPRVRAAGLACLLRDPKPSAYDWARPPVDAEVLCDAAAFAKVATDRAVLGVLLNDEPQSGDMAAPGQIPFVILFPYRGFKNDWYDDFETKLRLRSTGVFHYPDAPRQGEHLSASALVRSIVMSKDEDEYTPPSVTARLPTGEYVDETGRAYLTIVDKDLTYSFKFDIELRRPVVALQRVNPYTGAEEPFEGEQNWLAPGGAILIRVD